MQVLDVFYKMQKEKKDLLPRLFKKMMKISTKSNKLLLATEHDNMVPTTRSFRVILVGSAHHLKLNLSKTEILFIWSFLTEDATQLLVQVLIISCLDSQPL